MMLEHVETKTKGLVKPYRIALKLRSHRANGRVTDKTSLNPLVSVRIRLMSVSNPVNPFLVR